MRKFSTAFGVFLVLISFSAYVHAQGSFFIRGQVEKSDKVAGRDVPLANTTVALYKNDKKVTFQKTEKNGEFEFKKLEYGSVYKVTFKAPNCIEMFLVLDANIPAKKMDFELGFQSNFIMYDDKDKEINAKKFNYPFMKIAFNGKDLAPDKKYMDDFKMGIIPEMKADEEKALADQKTLAEQQAKEKQESELKEKQRKEEEELAKKKIKIAGKLLAGDKPSKPIANTDVLLVNDKEEVVQTVTTNFMGAFVFNVLPATNYSIKVNESNNQVAPNAKITFTNKDDKEVQITYADSKGKFAIKMLTNDSQTLALVAVNDADVKIDIKGKILEGDDGKNRPLSDVKINLVNKMQEIVQSTKTDKDGSFAFKRLATEPNYLLSLDENDPQLSSLKKVLLTDEHGTVVKESQKGKDNKFKFELLPYEVNKMSKMYVDDPWLEILDPKFAKSDGMVITERVYFKVNDEKLLPDAERTLDKVISIMNNVQGISIELSSHTDSQGADDYNLKLSEKRAKAAADYMIAHGVTATRVTGKGYGETRLLNNCGNGVKCTEDEHAKNRRLEFKVIKK